MKLFNSEMLQFGNTVQKLFILELRHFGDTVHQ